MEHANWMQNIKVTSYKSISNVMQYRFIAIIGKPEPNNQGISK